MCNTACYDFVIDRAFEPPLRTLDHPRVLEIGSRFVNGSPRPLLTEVLSPREYVGVDIIAGRYVDRVMDVKDVRAAFGDASFDLVVSTEFLEHAPDWRLAISTMKSVVKPGGQLLLTTRSRGFGYHGYPHDYWRYELGDMRAIFADGDLLALASDPLEPGVFVHYLRRGDRPLVDLAPIALYSMVFEKVTTEVPARPGQPPLGRRIAAMRARAMARVRSALRPGGRAGAVPPP